MVNFTALIDSDSEINEEQYDDPNKSEWIIGVDMDHKIFIICPPNIHYSFFDNGYNAEDLGFRYGDTNLDPGIYSIVVDFVRYEAHYELGYEYEYYFCFNPDNAKALTYKPAGN